jgi:2'-5' RNA ligase
MTRTFIALEMNDIQQHHLTGVIRQVALLLPSVRWVNPASIHLTLAFLGEIDDQQLADTLQATETVARMVPSFSYSLSHLGIFGSPRQPRTIWMGIDEPADTRGVLRHLHHLLNRELAQRGFPVDDRPFSPHLTLARLKTSLPPDEQQQLQSLLKSKQEGIASSGSYPVRSIDVMKSELLKTGARYTCLRACTLSG